MILVESSNRLVTVQFKKDGFMQVLQVRPDDDPSKIKVFTLTLSPAEQSKLVELIQANLTKPTKIFDIEDEEK